MTEWTLASTTKVPAGTRLDPDMALLSVRYEGKEALIGCRTLREWNPPTWVQRWCLLYDQVSQSCSLALLIVEQSVSRRSTEMSVAALTARTLRSLLTHCSQLGHSPIEVALEATDDAQNALERVLVEFRSK